MPAKMPELPRLARPGCSSHSPRARAGSWCLRRSREASAIPARLPAPRPRLRRRVASPAGVAVSRTGSRSSPHAGKPRPSARGCPATGGFPPTAPAAVVRWHFQSQSACSWREWYPRFHCKASARLPRRLRLLPGKDRRARRRTRGDHGGVGCEPVRFRRMRKNAALCAGWLLRRARHF